MRTTLKHYQVLGVAFMRDRENESHEPRGGILADEMGLGKTLMMLGIRPSVSCQTFADPFTLCF